MEGSLEEEEQRRLAQQRRLEELLNDDDDEDEIEKLLEHQQQQITSPTLASVVPTPTLATASRAAAPQAPPPVPPPPPPPAPPLSAPTATVTAAVPALEELLSSSTAMLQAWKGSVTSTFPFAAPATTTAATTTATPASAQALPSSAADFIEEEINVPSSSSTASASSSWWDSSSTFFSQGGGGGGGGTTHTHTHTHTTRRNVAIKLRYDNEKGKSGGDMLGLVTMIILSHGLVVKEEKREGPDLVLVVERGNNSSSSSSDGSNGESQQQAWDVMILRLGVTLLKGKMEGERRLRVSFLATAAGGNALMKWQQPSAVMEPARSSIGAAFLTSLGAALKERQLLLSQMELGTDTDTQTSRTLDVGFVQDLQAAFAQEMMRELEGIATPFDSQVQQEEVRCATLMTALQPAYARRQMAHALPPPTRAKALHAFPLDIRGRPSLVIDHKSNTHTHAHTQAHTQAFALLQQHQSLASPLKETIHRLCTDLSQRATDEQTARLHRKKLQVTNRFDNVNRHRRALVKTLLTPTPGAVSSTIDQQAATLLPLPSQQQYQQQPQVVVLYDFAATLQGRLGRVFLTYGHVLFHSSLLGFSLQRTIPFSDIERVECGSLSTLALGGKTVVVCEYSGTQHTLLVATQAEVAVEVLRQVLEVWKEEQQQTYTNTSASSYHATPVAIAAPRPIIPPPPPLSAGTDEGKGVELDQSPGGNGGGRGLDKLLQDKLNITISSSTASQPVPIAATTTTTTTTKGQQTPPLVRPRSGSLRKGIEAFFSTTPSSSVSSSFDEKDKASGGGGAGGGGGGGGGAMLMAAALGGAARVSPTPSSVAGVASSNSSVRADSPLLDLED